MNTLSSSISNQFGKSMILGTLLPVTIFVIAWLVIVAPLMPPNWSLLEAFDFFGTPSEIIALSFFTIMMTVLLHNFNSLIIRFYSGYPWSESIWGKWRTQRYQKEFEKIHARCDGLYVLLSAMGRHHAEIRPLVAEWSKVGRRKLSDFPERRDLVLPTRLGNRVRSVERYPAVQYGIDMVVLWPRLQAVLDKDYATRIDDAQISFNFMVNLSVLSILLAVFTGCIGLLYPPPGAFMRVMVPVLMSLALAYCFYRLSVSQVNEWGGLARGAFDLYKGKLLTQLGYEQKPKDPEEERKLWDNITFQMMLGDQQKDIGKEEPRVQYADSSPPSTRAVARPGDARLEITRGVRRARKKYRLVVHLGIRNSSDKQVTGLIVTDTLPDGLDYEWDSASVAGRDVRVEGTNPYTFYSDGPLECQSQIVLTYQAVRHE